MKPLFFENQSQFREWLLINHQLETELLVGFHKINSNKASMTWPQSVDQALCFGWIDGVRRSIDTDSYSIRFTPRKATSIWSAINIQKIEDLTQQGLMYPAGIASFKLRKEDKSRIYTHEIAEVHFSDEFEKIFKTNEKAWNYFQALAPSYKKVSKNWVMSAKQEATRIKRLNELIADSAESKNKWKY